MRGIVRGHAGALIRQTIGALKSSPLPRKTPLRPGNPPRRRTPIRREGPRGRARRTLWEVITLEAIEAVGGVCQVRVRGVCTGRAQTGHHKLPRGRGGPDTRENCLPSCDPCHEYVTDHPAWAVARGFTLAGEGGEG